MAIKINPKKEPEKLWLEWVTNNKTGITYLRDKYSGKVVANPIRSVSQVQQGGNSFGQTEVVFDGLMDVTSVD